MIVAVFPGATVLVFVLANFGDLVSGEKQYYITPSPSDPCPTNSCLTFDQFAANSTDYLKDNTTLLFLEGTHTIESGFFVKRVDAFSMRPNSSSNVLIICNGNSSVRMRFIRMNRLHIKGLTFIGCSGNKIRNVQQFVLEDSNFIGESEQDNINLTREGTPLELLDTSATIIGSKLSLNSGNKMRTLPCSRSYYNYYFHVWGGMNPKLRVGGAILATRSILTIVNSTFEGNSANAGGAIYAELQSNVTIINSRFVDNSATLVGLEYDCQHEAGGVLYINSNRTSNVTIKGSVFEYNSGAWLGGVISFSASTTDHAYVTITDSDFVSNAAERRGGVIDLSNSKSAHISIFGSRFQNNSARYGGSVNVVGTKRALIDIYNSSFSNNSAFLEAGVLDASEATNTMITITDSKFIGNHVKYDRAGVVDVTRSQNATMDILRSEFIGNKAEGGGGVLDVSYATNMTVTISHSKFEYNVAKGYDGGAVNFWDSSNLTVSIKASSFNNNTANGARGGAIGLSHDANASLIISESNFTKNYAKEAGAIYCVASKHLSKVVIVGSIFENNHASLGGGVLRTHSSTVEVATSLFAHNRAKTFGGTIMSTGRGEIVVRDSHFYKNRASYGGVICAQGSAVRIKTIAMTSTENKAETYGGVFHIYHSNVAIIGGNFSHNRAEYNGGIMSATRAVVMFSNATVDHNSAGNDGGVMRSIQSEVKIYDSSVLSNHAEKSGGVFSDEQNNLRINRTSFMGNRANTGGILQAELGTSTFDNSLFLDNTAHTGGVMHVVQSTVYSHGSHITKNSGLISIVYLSDSTAVFSKLDFSNNVGTLLAFGSSLTIADDSHLTSNKHPTQWTNVRKFFEGGAITVFQGDLVFNGSCELKENEAEDGGAIKAIESKIQVHGKVKIENNVASKTGGGMYLHFSELTSFPSSSLDLVGNAASNKGGGIYTIGSTIRVKESASTKRKSTLRFVSNRAEKGGGLYIRRNSKLYIIKSRRDVAAVHNQIITFTRNSAEFGGAIYASDDGMCSLFVNSTRDDCFFQTLAMYGATTWITSEAQCRNMFFVNNTAEVSGHSLFGGLLDSCKVNPFAESVTRNRNLKNPWTNEASVMRGHKYFRRISNIRDSDIGSHPVRVCFCKGGNPDCTYQPDPIHIRKGKERKLVLSVAVVDQINRPIKSAALYSHLGSGNDVCQNHIQKVNGNCSKVNFALFSNNDTEELILSLGRGPCKQSEESKARVTLEFSCLQCPIGFELDVTREGCHCVCDSQLFPFFTNCSGEVLIRERNVWIANLAVNTSFTQYLIHPFCPLNYCYPPSSRVKLNFNTPNGVDGQCADSRSGLLCGTCQPGLSLSLGSSRCLTCSTHWLAILLVILMVAFIAGILLVVSLLVLNLTVAVGTLNGIIFYANIVAANGSIYLPSSCPNFVTVFVSWLNLEIGFDTCFFEGMDAYWKTLIQLIFPTYVILLVVVVIIISEASSRFAKLIGKRNPVATLATLILLCYAKLLHTIIASLSFTVLHYPNGSRQTVWLPDATVPYLRGKHTALFGLAVLILIVGIAFTALLLSWQWILRLQNIKGFKWMNYQKLFHFIEPYHAPYTFKYRYWTGLLLLVRVVLYLVSAVNVEGDPRVTLVANIFVIGSLLLVKGVVQKWIYKKWPVDVLESIMYFNILAFSAFTWYTLDSDRSQGAVACTSVLITFFLLTCVIFFHVYKYTSLGSTIKHNHAFKWILANVRMKKARDSSKGEGEPTKPTYSVVELHDPHKIIRQPSVVEEEATY